MKKYIKTDKMIVIIPAMLMVFVLGGLIYILSASSNIRMYKSTLCSLASGPYEVTAEYDGTTVSLHPDNQRKLLNFFASADYYTKGRAKPSGDVIHYYFNEEDTEWTVNVYEVSDDELLFEVNGDKNFSFTMDNKGKFKKYIKLGTPDGWEMENDVL